MKKKIKRAIAWALFGWLYWGGYIVVVGFHYLDLVSALVHGWLIERGFDIDA